MKKFYSREEQLKALEKIEESSNSYANFTIITGRRRIGKTALVQEFVKDTVIYLLIVLQKLCYVKHG